MRNKKYTKQLLIYSLLSIVVCTAMFIGSTFAWFTDSVTSGKNQIQAGNLSVKLEYSNDLNQWSEVGETTNVFLEDAKWEPGHTEVVYFRITNDGSLALKYKLSINGTNNVIGKTEDDLDIDLTKFIKFGIIDDITEAFTQDSSGRKQAKDAVESSAVLISEGYSEVYSLLPGPNANAKVMAMVVYMPEVIGNEANHGIGKIAPSLDLGINLIATQDTYETDSFDQNYDKDAVLPVDVSNIEDINDIIANSSIADINLTSGNNLEGKITVSADKTVKLTISEGSTIAPIEDTGKAVINKGNLTLHGTGDILGESSQIPVANRANLTIDDNINISVNNASSTEGVLSNAMTGVLYISDGKFEARGSSGVAVKNAGGKAYISGGSFKGELYAFFTSGDGLTEISGGTFDGKIYSANGQGQSSTTYISGGQFKNGTLSVSPESNIIVTGGTFIGYTLNNVNQFVAQGYQAIEQDGVITVVESN